jgi:hypothetical protein
MPEMQVPNFLAKLEVGVTKNAVGLAGGLAASRSCRNP